MTTTEMNSANFDELAELKRKLSMPEIPPIHSFSDLEALLKQAMESVKAIEANSDKIMYNKPGFKTLAKHAAQLVLHMNCFCQGMKGALSQSVPELLAATIFQTIHGLRSIEDFTRGVASRHELVAMLYYYIIASDDRRLTIFSYILDINKNTFDLVAMTHMRRSDETSYQYNCTAILDGIAL